MRRNRTNCPICGREVSQAKDGRIHRHSAGVRKLCPGTGFKPYVLEESVWKNDVEQLQA